MRFTPTSKYLSLAKGLAKQIAWKVYVKKTTDISEALSVGTWLEATDRVIMDSFPSQGARLEYEIGQYTSDSVSFTIVDIAWWKANVFNATVSQYIECKVKFELGDCSDTVYTFSGFVDKLGRGSVELDDQTTLSAFTAQDLGARIAGENASKQYIEDDTEGNGTGTDGLILPTIRNMWVTNANIASYVLKVGVHTVTYDYNGGTRRAKLDNGAWVNLGAGNNILGNGETSPEDTERITVYVRSLAILSSPADSVSDKIIVITAGSTLPNIWYRNSTAQRILSVLFNQIGIADQLYDTLEVPTWDGSIRTQMLDYPPEDGYLSASTYAITNDGTDLFIAVKNKVYRRTINTGIYTLLITLSDATSLISKLMYNARNGHLWVFYGKGGTLNGYLRRYIISSDTLSSEIALSAVSDATWHYSIEVKDYNYAGSSWKYSVVYTNANLQQIREVDGATLADSLIFAKADLGGGSFTILSDFMHTHGADAVKFKCFNTDGATRIYNGIAVNGSGTWTNNGTFLTGGLDDYRVAAFDSINSRIYYRTINVTPDKIRSHTTSSTATTGHLTLAANDSVEAILYGEEDGNTYFSVAYLNATSKLYNVTGTSSAVELSTGYHAKRTALTFFNARLYGVTVLHSHVTDGTIYSEHGRLFQAGAFATFVVRVAAFEGMSITDSLYRVLQAFNLIGTINSYKQGKVYRRGNATGVPQTSGSTLSLTINEASNIMEENADYCARFDWVQVSNGTVTWSFDGTNYQTKVLSDARTLSIQNELIPDEIVQDVCHYAYQFFKTDRLKYTFNLGVIPLFQYEPLDGCDITFTTTKIQKTGSGVIYGTTCYKDGSMDVEVLI